MVSEARRFNVVACGRRWGKTALGIDKAVETLADGYPVGWFAPTYKTLLEVWDEIVDRLGPVIKRKNATDRRIDVVNGATLECWSLDKADAGRGRRYKRVILDEAAYAPYLEKAWEGSIRPTLTDWRGDAWFLSSTNGRNYFYRLYQRGISGDSGWVSWQMPTSTNPYIDSEEIIEARRDLPESKYAQEYEAAFTEDAGMVFRGVRECIGLSEPVGRLVAGLDWAQSKDYTALAIVDDAGQVHAIDRFNQIGWQVQRDRVMAAVHRWGVAEIVAEYNSIGGPNIEELQAAGLPVTAFNTSNESKTRVIQQLVGAFERREIRIPNDPVLIGELEAYEAKRLPSGKWQYSAPSGMHDDTVIALALAWEARLMAGRYTVSVSANPFF